MRILLIEDNNRLAESIVSGLIPFGFGVDPFSNPDDGLSAKKQIDYDAIILDLGLPDRDGIDVLGEIRQSDKSTPVLIVTARDSIDDRVRGLDHGADDYVLKPFAMKELAARLRALLRRPGRALGKVLDAGNIQFDTIARQVRIADRVVSMPRRELAALELMLRQIGDVVSKAALEDTLYGLTEDVSPNAVEAVVSRLRKRLEGEEASCAIHTLRGIGYLLKEQ